MNSRSSISQAAQHALKAQHELERAVADAYGTMPVAAIAEQAGVSRPTVYAILREAGVQLKGKKT